MIKLVIPDSKEREKDFLTAILQDVADRVEYLTISLGHLKGKSIQFKAGRNGFQDVTADAIKIIEGSKYLTDEDYNRAAYAMTVGSYLKGSNQMHLYNIKGVENFLQEVSSDDNKLLKEILICPADNLYQLNKTFIKDYNIGQIELELLGLVFDYGRYSTITKKIQGYFRHNNFIRSCPYCNLEEVKYKKGTGGVTATVHQLDHFFSQSDFPLLSYSMYNLIPSGAVCNSKTNKGKIPFNDEFYLNPYITGFDDSVSFYPVMNGEMVSHIRMQVNCASGSKRFKQLLGSKGIIDESSNEGNINVFKLEGKYGDFTDEAETILRVAKKANNGMRSIGKFIDMMRGIDLEAIHRQWYNDEVRTPFEPDRFLEKMHSKFNRDIHDYYYNSVDKSIFNNHIRRIIVYTS